MLEGIVWEIIYCNSCNKYLGRRQPTGPQQSPAKINLARVVENKEVETETVERLTSYAQDGVG